MPCFYVSIATWFKALRFGSTGAISGWPSRANSILNASPQIAVLPAVPEVLRDVSTTNNFIRTHALVRVQPSAGRVRPYAEGLLGFSYVFTETAVDLGYEGGGASTTHLGDYAPSFGAGGGVTIGLGSWSTGRLGLDIGLRYLTGGEVDYLTQGELQRDETGVTFEPTRSLPTLFGVQLGITVDF